ncbi:hypothetical protein RHMOL_Rhmol06G0265800 [Rhododendron molle]|uniref:Uncharacterized protein n=1 Tax=Rhododendron molle TaxID=49168 RepID=A0ACC0NI49_RHOML|nr:hypothetical protein RHMOL_Rhmol06G0265800 [Rhododendron molle]
MRTQFFIRPAVAIGRTSDTLLCFSLWRLPPSNAIKVQRIRPYKIEPTAVFPQEMTHQTVSSNSIAFTRTNSSTLIPPSDQQLDSHHQL